MEMENRTLTLVCDGSLQILGDFHGIGTYCVVRNEEYSSPVMVDAKGIKQALVAPGHAIACRSSMIKVQGPAGAVVALDFLGFPEPVAAA